MTSPSYVRFSLLSLGVDVQATVYTKCLRLEKLALSSPLYLASGCVVWSNHSHVSLPRCGVVNVKQRVSNDVQELLLDLSEFMDEA